MKVEDKRLIIFRKKVVSWQYRAVSDFFFFFLRVRRIKEDRYQKQPAAAHPWVASRRADPSHPHQPLASQPDVGAQMVFVPTPALPHGPPLQAMASPDSAQTLCWNIRLFVSHFCWEIRSQTINHFFFFTPNLFLPQSSRLSTRTPTFWLLLSDSLVPSATLPVLSQASPAHVPTGRQLLTDPPWPPLVDATATCDVDRSGRLLRSP